MTRFTMTALALRDLCVQHAGCFAIENHQGHTGGPDSADVVIPTLAECQIVVDQAWRLGGTAPSNFMAAAFLSAFLNRAETGHISRSWLSGCHADFCDLPPKLTGEGEDF